MKIFEHKGDDLRGFMVLSAESLEEIHRRIDEILNNPKISLVVHCPLVLPVGATRFYYKDTSIVIRYWLRSNFMLMHKEPVYDVALKLVRK